MFNAEKDNGVKDKWLQSSMLRKLDIDKFKWLLNDHKV